MVDYKVKYIELRNKFMESCDRFYRLGKEEGLKQGQMQAAAQMQQPQEPQIDPETGEMVDQQSQDIAQQEMAQEQDMQEEPSELDAKIEELENLVQKGEKPKVTDLREVVLEMSELRKKEKARLSSGHKKVVVSEQKDLVDDILKKWEKEATSQKVTENLEDIILKEGIKL